ncbi:MAG: alpha/beta hydrolase [Lachnospiraceae bacterium]|nr:alpha/beta hydrolase [Lachnospiraceae bacterium]
MQIQQIQITDYTCSLFLPKDYNESGRNYPVIYINGDVPIEEIISEIRKSGCEADFILLSIQPESWNDDFTPWGAPAFRKGEDAPAGRADVYISRLTSEIKPYMDAIYRTKPEPEYTALFGYSLGGLAAAYAMYKTDLFGTVASLSGSLWYEGFSEFMEKERPVRKDMKVYLSLGKKESLSRNPRMCKVAECTERAKDILTKQAEAVCFEWNEGGHFHDIPKRFAKAVVWWRSLPIAT